MLILKLACHLQFFVPVKSCCEICLYIQVNVILVQHVKVKVRVSYSFNLLRSLRDGPLVLFIWCPGLDLYLRPHSWGLSDHLQTS